MIHAIGAAIRAQLAAKKCPLPVIDGPEPAEVTSFANERVVIEHDEDAGDSFSGPRTQHKNPRMRMVRHVGAKITIYAKAPSGGATHWEHRERAEHVLDLVLVALNDVLVTARQGYAISKAKFVEPEDFTGTEIAAGAKYQLTLTIERGVFDQTWAYENKPEATLADGMVTNKTQVKLAGDTSDAPETACGA